MSDRWSERMGGEPKVRGYARALVICWALVLAVALPAQAGKVQVTGEQMAFVDIATGTFVFDGPVTVTDGSVTIEGTKLIYRSKEEIVQFVGEVSIEREGTSLSGRDLVYDLSKGEGTLSDALASTTPAGAISPVFVMGEQVTACSERTQLVGTRLTTCDPKNPGYYLASRSVEIVPGERLVLYNVSFVESGITLFYWPRVTFSLKRADPDSASEEVALPRIGYSTTEGWYVKSSFGYRGPKEQRGRILVDYMQLLGWGFGVNHTFHLSTTGSDRLFLYAQPNRNTGRTNTELSLTMERSLASGLKLYSSSSVLSNYDEGEQLTYENKVSFTHSREDGSSSLSYSDTRLVGVEQGYEVKGDLVHSQAYAGGWRLRLNGSVDKRDRTYASQRNLVGYLAELGRETPDWGLDIVAEDRFNPDLAKEILPEIKWGRAKRLPEVRLRLDNIMLGGRPTPLAAEASWGQFTEDRQSGFGALRLSTYRTHVRARVKPLSFGLGPLGRLQWGGGVARRTYGTGERQWVATAESQYRLAISPALSLNGDYRYEQGIGDASPLNFDRVIDQERVQARLEYRTNTLGWTLAGGYDLMQSAPTDLIGSIRLQPSEAMRLQTQAAYSLVDEEWVYVIGTAQYMPGDHFSLQLGTRYNVPLQRADRIDAMFTWDLGTWQLRYAGIYDGINRKFDRGDFTITRDLGCRAIDLRYNQSRKEVWLEYRITAFPDASVKVGATEKHLMFDARGWEEVLAME